MSTSEEFETRRELVGGGARGGTRQKPHGTHKTHKFAPGVSWWAGGGRARYDRHNFLSFCFLATLLMGGGAA